MKVKTPCEVVVWEILPAIRAALAAELVQSGVSQQNVATLFGMAPSAVSQYLTKKRGYKIEFDDEIKDAIAELSGEIKEGKDVDIPLRFCQICRQLRSEGERCPADGEI
ncbi:putative transcriptional regulator [Methanohalophilus levihalophilus]|uniref:transcriptional regulator n=1 Tax=Methanohalophilus levihalophilus TaxID=1431282 RepID=UPI001AEA0D09|nr:transcriptional regulator [Methanohalophilus levihalophilus]MBP2030261.1 putative transcriptional regulator [Methanohalophilus levihalophilus]